MPKPSRREYAVAILLGPSHGLHPRMAKFWPAANNLSKAERIAVIRATRRGQSIAGPRLAGAVIDYSGAVREAFKHDRHYRWTEWLITMVCGAALCSILTLNWVPALVGMTVAFAINELLLWPRHISNAELAEKLARQT